MPDDVWRDRPGPIGGLPEREWHEQHGLPPTDPVAAIKAVLAAIASNDPVRICTDEYDAAGGFVLTDQLVSRLEVANAVSRLPSPLREAIECTYLCGMDRSRTAWRLRVPRALVDRYLDQAFAILVQHVFDYTT